MRNSIYELYGFAAISCVGVVLALFIQQALGMPEVVHAISEFSPWAGRNAQALSWTAFAIVMVITGVIPPVLMMRDDSTNGSRLGTLGVYVCAALAIPSVCYLLTIGWVAGKHLLER